MTAIDYQNLILEELALEQRNTALGQDGASNPALVPSWWAAHAAVDARDPDFRTAGPHLRYLYCRRDALEKLVIDIREQVNSKNESSGITRDYSDRVEYITGAIERLTVMIAAVEARGPGHRAGGAQGAVTATAPVVAPVGVPDADGMRYRGSPYFRMGRRR